MNCSTCGHENSTGNRFCGGCGAALQEITKKRPAHKSTPRDYTPKHLADKILQSKSALEGERKQVTVLFADVKGSMELAEQLDPEEWHALLDRFFAILTDGVHRFEGTVNQYTGDGIMALFGAPIAHEDHAQRACYAALHLREEIARYATEVKREHGVGFSTRMGLNSGEVVVGKIGDDLRMDYTAQGHTVGLAQRMEALAEPNSCYLTAATAALAGGYFALDYARYGEEAARIAAECDDPALRAAIGTFPAFGNLYTGDGKAMLTWTERVLNDVGTDNLLGKEIVGYSPRASMFLARPWGLMYLGRLEEAWTRVRAAERVAEESRELEVLGWVQCGWTALAYTCGDSQPVLDRGQRSLDIAEKLDNESSRVIAYLSLGYGYLIDAQPLAAREALRESAAIIRERRTQRGQLPWVLALLAEAHVALGERAEALAAAQEGINLASARRLAYITKRMGSLRSRWPCWRRTATSPARRSSPRSNAPSIWSNRSKPARCHPASSNSAGAWLPPSAMLQLPVGCCVRRSISTARSVLPGTPCAWRRSSNRDALRGVPA